MDQSSQDFFAPCPRGLESVLMLELEKLDAQAIKITQGGVSFSGNFNLCYQANLFS